MASQADRRRETRDKILQAAFRLFAKQGYDDTSVDQIVAKADVAKGTFYQYFETKIDVAIALAEHNQQLTAERVDARLEKSRDPLAVGVELLKNMAANCEEHPSLVRPLLLHALQSQRPETQTSTRGLLVRIIAAAQAKKRIRADVDAHFVSALIAGSLFFVTLHWTADPQPGTLQARLAAVWKLHLEGALPR